MLSENRMMAIATEFNYELRHWEGPQTKEAHVAIFMRAIRLAVAETAEACARRAELASGGWVAADANKTKAMKACEWTCIAIAADIRAAAK